MSKKTSIITLEVNLDENSVPEGIRWSATDVEKNASCKAFLLSIWDNEDAGALRMDLWNKEMRTDEMQLFVLQTLVSLADTLERSTGEKGPSAELRTFAREFGKKMKLIKD